MGTSSRYLSIKSAYRKIKEKSWNPKGEAWRFPLKAERLRCSVSSDARCSICGHGIEDVLHVIRDCDTAKKRRLSKALIVGPNNTVLFAREGDLRDMRGASSWWKQKGGFAYGLTELSKSTQIDNMEVIRDIKESFLKDSNSALIRRIIQLLRNEAKWSIDYVPKEDNKEADQITKLTFDREKGLQLYVVSPLVLCNVFIIHQKKNF
ncbi:hypothetical protein Gotri_001509 [Gossypium trilobum]|uniref:RNase H type-1 domain-containing protein n=1 Tax=Gossypium trilobum TaxID=34281 RepID=A0A7J9FEW9_9ROSI|nr:hypothetical protein [Gossypium trilobum]